MLKKLLLFTLALQLFACSGSDQTAVSGGGLGPIPDNPVIPQPPVLITLSSIAITPNAPSAAPGQSVQLTATGTYSDGTTADLTSQATWTSSDPATGTVDNLGRATGVATGTAVITATLGEVVGQAPFTVVGSSSVTINQQLSPRAIPGEVTTVRLTGRDAADTILFGPQDQPLTQVNVFTGIPVNVTSLQIDYLESGALRGTFLLPCALTEGGNFVIDDPDWADAPPAATSFAFVKAPDPGFPNFALNPIQIRVRDQFGNDFTPAVPVTVALVGSGASLTGTLTRNSVNGVATFDDLVIDNPGTFQLLVTSPGLATRISQSFSISSEPQTIVGDFLTYSYIVATGTPGTIFPPYAQLWDLNTAFMLEDGFSDTWDQAMTLQIGGVSYPADQVYANLTFLTPLITAAQGLQAAISSNFENPAIQAAYLPPAAETSLAQTLDLTSATGAVTLTWTDQIFPNAPFMGQPFNYQVVIRSEADGSLLATAFQTNGGAGNTMRNFNLTAFAGQRVVLSFEANNFVIHDPGTGIRIDDVAVVDGAAVDFVTNGNFSSNLDGWSATTAPQSQNVQAESRQVPAVTGLDVVRTAYSRPDQIWIRYCDDFTNNTGAPITTTLNYRSNLGSDGGGRNRVVPGTSNEAVSSSDTSTDSDCGFVFGTGATLIGFSLTTENIDWDIPVTVQPGQTVTVITFALQNGVNSGGANPTAIEAETVNIVTNFRSDETLQEGLTGAQLQQCVNL